METLRKIWSAWKQFGQKIGDFFARVVLSIFYFTIFFPFGLGLRLFGDPLTLKSFDDNEVMWLERETKDLVIDDARRLS